MGIVKVDKNKQRIKQQFIINIYFVFALSSLPCLKYKILFNSCSTSEVPKTWNSLCFLHHHVLFTCCLLLFYNYTCILSYVFITLKYIAPFNITLLNDLCISFKFNIHIIPPPLVFSNSLNLLILEFFKFTKNMLNPWVPTRTNYINLLCYSFL